MNKEEYDSGIKIKSVFCFVISPNMRRKGISKLLLEQVCKDAELDGFNYVEGQPNIKFISKNSDFFGPKTLYEKCGFYKHQEYPDRIIMRKKYNENIGK
ncbi:MAG: GNAT family N-acetyltransferase, partial [Spirochaetaceae bacterium]|jgi:GNAT superfamily N-acetyltransferase|nr:GNAT family N-acetyltransferase [Spirochaetaceae bacterium]